jgi:hypothetical protein
LKPLPGFAFVSVEPACCSRCWTASSAARVAHHATRQAAIAPAAQRFLALMLRSFAAELTAAWAPVTPRSNSNS